MQTSRMRVSASLPIRCTSIASGRLSTESRFTAQRRGTGSSPGSSTTSLTKPRTFVVHGATSALRCRGIAASRESTTTGRRPIAGISHHHTSPRAGSAVTIAQPPRGTRPNRPIHRAQSADACHKWRSFRRSLPHDSDQSTRATPRRSLMRPSLRSARAVLHPADRRPPSCSAVFAPCHNHATACRVRVPAIPATRCRLRCSPGSCTALTHERDSD